MKKIIILFFILTNLIFAINYEEIEGQKDEKKIINKNAKKWDDYSIFLKLNYNMAGKIKIADKYSENIEKNIGYGLEYLFGSKILEWGFSLEYENLDINDVDKKIFSDIKSIPVYAVLKYNFYIKEKFRCFTGVRIGWNFSEKEYYNSTISFKEEIKGKETYSFVFGIEYNKIGTELSFNIKNYDYKFQEIENEFEIQTLKLGIYYKMF